MISIPTSPTHISMFRKFNTWYSVKDGNWNDPTIWISNGKKKNNSPQPGDDVYISNTITMDSNIVVKNMYITGKLQGVSTSAFNITINGNIHVNGVLDLSLQFNNLILKGYSNIIPYANFNAGNFSTVTYSGVFSQDILNLPYRNLTTNGAGKKFQRSNLTILGNFNQQSDYEVGAYDLTVTGTSILGTVGSFAFTKSGSGNLLFIGDADFEGTADFSAGNPAIEFRGGIQIHTFSFTSGSGVVSFTTNNQALNASAQLGGAWNSPISIVGNITVTVQGAFTTNSTINGTVSGSTLNNDGALNLKNSTAPMLTGVFNYMHDANSTLGLLYDGSYTLPYSTYANLVLDGIGTKKLLANTVVNKNLTTNSDFGASYFDTNGYNLNVKGTYSNGGGFIASAYSSLLFEGLVSLSNGTAVLGADLRTGNPDIEFRGGLYIHANYTYTGTGVWKFTTNNQTFDMNVNNGGAISCNMLIDAIVLTWINGFALAVCYINGTINGTGVSSTLINKGILGITNAQQPMQTGVLNASGFTNTFIYSGAAQDVTPGTYKNLTLNGSGAKKLLDNVSVLNTYILTSPATLNNNGFTLTNP